MASIAVDRADDKIFPGICINYMHDLDWLGSEAPSLKDAPLGLLYQYIEGDMSQWPNVRPHKPEVPPYGTHHTKCLILAHDGGRVLRVCVQTANNLYTDNFQLTDAVWVQDFPAKPVDAVESSCQFEEDLVDYMQQSRWPGILVPGRGHVGSVTLRSFDFSAARAVLIPSVPGAHAGPRLHRYGHMRLRTALAAHRFPARFAGGGIVWQVSSVGAATPAWLAELRESFSAGRADAPAADAQLGPPSGPVRIVWPTMEEVRMSRLGWAMGGSLPGAQDKIARLSRPEVRSLVQLCRWAGADAGPEGRGRNMPHIKTYLRFADSGGGGGGGGGGVGGGDGGGGSGGGGSGGIAWAMLGSHNLSPAAWGRLERGGQQLRIRSFELSVLLLPSLLPPPPASPTVIDVDSGAGAGAGAADAFMTKAMRAEAMCGVALPVPYAVPPPAYGAGDVPWAWDAPLLAPDAHGRSFPRGLTGS